MSIQSDDSFEVSRYNMSQLLKDNQIKDIALSKATTLIKLLSAELQLERTTKAEAMSHLQQTLRYQFSHELEKMREKAKNLQFELKRCQAVSNNRTIRHASLTRSQSTTSFPAKRRKTLNKRQTESNQQDSNPLQMGFSLALLSDCLLQFQELRDSLIDNLGALVQLSHEDFQETLTRVYQRQSELEQVISQCLSLGRLQIMAQLQKENRELRAIIKEDQRVINQLKAHLQSMEDTAKHFLFKMSNFPRSPDFNIPYFDCTALSIELRLLMSRAWQKSERRCANLEEQNLELKSILDGIISVLQRQRREVE